MTLKELFGVLLVAAAIAIALLAYPLSGVAWYWTAIPLLVAGLLLIRRAQRERRTRPAHAPRESTNFLETLDDAFDAWGDRHHLSGSHASDRPDLDLDGD
jgi:hypothetical protein